MSKIETASAAERYAAIKLIEGLFHEGEIPAHMFQNILKEYGKGLDKSSFKGYEAKGKA